MLSPRNAPTDGSGKDSKNILRGLPVKPPPSSASSSTAAPSLQEQLLRLKRLGRLATAGVGLVVLVAVGAFLYFRNGTPASPPAGKEEEVKAAGKEFKFSPGKLGALKPLPAFSDASVGKKTSGEKSTGEGKGREPYLETIGALSMVHLYQTYLNIGLLADAVENETYTYTEAVNVMLTVTELLTLVEKQLARMPSSGLTPEDESALEALRQLTGQLRTQANALVSYWASREESHATRYQAAREQSWNAIKEMMGLEE